jgi:hypothetical protein
MRSEWMIVVSEINHVCHTAFCSTFVMDDRLQQMGISGCHVLCSSGRLILFDALL